jgi:tRNA(fMet)-specific endonuclease VapC
MTNDSQDFSPRFALDTNTVIHYFKGMGKVGERLLATPPSDIAVPTVVVYELETGVLKAMNPQVRQAQLQTFLSHIKLLPFGRVEAQAAAQLRVSLEAQGLGIGPLDTLIAGTALAHGATLVSRNVREYARVPELKVTNWFE